MCLALIALDAHPDYAIVIVANRDEFHARPASPAGWWAEGWLGGRDLDGGGTWLGVARDGRYALLTNVREPQRHSPNAPSRGALVPTVLASAATPGEALAATVAAAAEHNGFNLLAGDAREAHWGSNRADRPLPLARGIAGLSNAALNTPWPKVERTRAGFAGWCAAGTASTAGLFALLRDDRVAPDEALPATGVPLDWERRLSAPFIVGERYGTRCTTVVTIRRDGAVSFVERRFDAAGAAVGESAFAFGAGAAAGQPA
jgi:uncharacterized protein with NRDE domain